MSDSIPTGEDTTPSDEGGGDDEASSRPPLRIEDLVQRGAPPTKVTSDSDLLIDDEDQRAEHARLIVAAKAASVALQRQELSLRKWYAVAAGVVVLLQIGLANWFFYKYASDGVQWVVPDSVMAAWLAAVVVQVIGVLLVITRNLFPNRDGPRPEDAEKK